MINQPKFPASHEDRHLLCQEEGIWLLLHILF